MLEVREVSKRYEIYESPQDRLRQFLVPKLQRTLLPARFRRPVRYFREFWALRDLTLELARGEALGVLGRNGAGKSTFLQIVAGTLTPTEGTVRVAGKVAALLELGSGFSPEFTGRENVFLNAALLGLSDAQIEERYGAIAEFADIGDFINQPVKTYSSGMMLRLAFAVQTIVEPDLLIVDEALSVGDARFQKKCFARLEQLRGRGTTILFVTHDTGTIVQFCSRAIILEQGRLFASGLPQGIAREYHKLLFGAPVVVAPGPIAVAPPAAAQATAEPADSGAGAAAIVDQVASAAAPDAAVSEVRYGTGDAQIVAIGLRDATGAATGVLETHAACEAWFRVSVSVPSEAGLAYGFIISNARGLEVFGTKSGLYATRIATDAADRQFECRLRFVNRLVPGRYFLSVAVAHDDDRSDGQFLDYRFDALEFQVVGPIRGFATSVIDLDAALSHAETAAAESNTE